MPAILQHWISGIMQYSSTAYSSAGRYAILGLAIWYQYKTQVFIIWRYQDTLKVLYYSLHTDCYCVIDM